MIGFRVVFQDFRLYDDYVQIGTGNDPFNNQSVITTIHGSIDYADDVYVRTNAMWFAVIGGKGFTSPKVDVEIISIDLSGECVIVLDLSYLNIIYVGCHCIVYCTS